MSLSPLLWAAISAHSVLCCPVLLHFFVQNMIMTFKKKTRVMETWSDYLIICSISNNSRISVAILYCTHITEIQLTNQRAYRQSE